MDRKKIKILVVDDIDANLLIIESILQDLKNIEIISTTSSERAIDLMLKNNFALVLLDVQMPVLNGFQLAKIIRSNSITQHIPIIFITAITQNPNQIFKGYNVGAVDFLFKPFAPEVLQSKVKIFAELYTQKKNLHEVTTKLNKKIDELTLSKEELKKAKNQAEKASQAKSNFLAHMSHEIRTPLGGIIGMAELLLLDELSINQRQKVETIKFSGESLLDIINEILDLSKIEANRIELEEIEFNPLNIIEKVLKMMWIKAKKKNIDFFCDTASNIPKYIKGDSIRLRQILFNLVGNAIKFTNKGYICLKINLLKKTTKKALIGFSIYDTGIGIHKEKQKTIFQSYKQADSSITRNYGGTGLGLPISKQLVKLMGGELKVESTYQKGSNFYFSTWFTCSNTEEEDINNIKDKKIFYADDNLQRTNIVKKFFNKKTINFHYAETDKILKNIQNAVAQNLKYDLLIINCSKEKKVKTLLKNIRYSIAFRNRPDVVWLVDREKNVRTSKNKEFKIKKILEKPLLVQDLYYSLNQIYNPKKLENQENKNSISEKYPSKNYTILVAEDQEINQEIIVGLLEAQGYKIIIAKNGKQAIEFAKKENFDLIVMDVQMPFINGFEATTAIRSSLESKNRTTPIIAMTAHAMQGIKEKCIASGMNGYVTKPIDSNIFYETVESFVMAESNALKESQLANPNRYSIDLKELMQRVQGKKNIAEKILNNFREIYPEILQGIKQSLEEKKFKEVIKVAHTLKGLLGNLSLQKAYDKSQELNLAAKNHDAEKVSILFLKLEEEINAAFKFYDEQLIPNWKEK